MRPAKFQLASKQVKEKHTAPFIDDLVVNPQIFVRVFAKNKKNHSKNKIICHSCRSYGDGNFISFHLET